jgi:hypothetical protein
MIAARARDHDFSSSDFLFNALRFMVAVIATLALALCFVLSCVPTSAVRPLPETPVRFVGAVEPEPGCDSGLELCITNRPHALFRFLDANDRTHQVAFSPRTSSYLQDPAFRLDESDNAAAASAYGCGVNGSSSRLDIFSNTKSFSGRLISC